MKHMSVVKDPRSSRQMDMPACPLGWLLAGIKCINILDFD